MTKRIAAGVLSLSALVVVAGAEEWPQWRGPRNDGIVRDEKIADQWPAGGPKRLWQKDVAIGFATPVAVDGKVYLFALEGANDVTYAFDGEKGTDLWKESTESLYKGKMPEASLSENWTGERASPVIEGKRIYTYGIRGDLICRDLDSGKLIWHTNVLNETSGEPITWGQASNPTIDGDVIYVQGGVAGPVVVCVNKESGKLIWQSENLPPDKDLKDEGIKPGEAGYQEKDKGGYARPIVAEVGGAKQLIVFGGEAVWGIDPKNGKALWSHLWPTQYDVNAATPIFHDGKLFVTSAYSTPPARCAQFEVTPTGLKQIWTNNQLTAKFQPPILDGGYLYGNSEGTVRCLKWEDGKTAWTATDRISQGGSMVRVAPDKLVMLTEQGKAILARATPEKYEKLSEAPVVERTSNAWASPLVYRGKMYVKGRKDFVCYDISAK